MSSRPDVRGGRATRGFPPGSAQALAAVVLGLLAGGTGVRRGQPVLAALFFTVAALAVLGLYRTYARSRRRP